MKRLGAAVLALGLWAAGPASGDPLIERAELTALIDAEWGVGLRDGSSHKAEVVAVPRLELDLAGATRLTATARVRADAFDRIEPGSPDFVEVSPWSRRRFWGSQLDYELRELFVETRVGPVDLTMGKQQIVWGESDGLKLLDVVDPQSFREFILDEFEDSRIPLWTLRAELPVPGGDLELIWVPDPTMHELPRPDALFAFRSPRLLPPRVPGAASVLLPIDRPGDPLGDSDAGVRFRSFVGGFDLSLAYLYQYDDRPVYAGLRGAGPTGPSVFFTPTYERTHLVGGTFANAFGDFTLRGELLWRSDRFLSTSDSRASRFLHQTPETAWVIGVDWFGLPDTLVSLQLFQSLLVDDAVGLLRDRLDTNLTLFVQHKLLNERLALEATWIHGVNDGDGVVRPRASYEVSDAVRVWIGVDVFYGSRQGVFGQYDALDRVVVGAEFGL